MGKFKIAILTDLKEHFDNNWVIACNRIAKDIDYTIIDILSAHWLEEINKAEYDIFLAKPPGTSSIRKLIFDERIFILSNILNKKIYPKPLEIFIYENKKFFYSWLQANNLPHPKTYIFNNKEEAIKYIYSTSYPIIAKMNIGASGSGVKFIRTINEASKYLNDVFSAKGISRRWGPNFSKGHIIKRGIQYFKYPKAISQKFRIYANAKKEKQTGFVIFQEYVKHDFEWRVVIIGESYFAHKKLKINNKASGTTLKDYGNPPLYILDFVKNIMDKFRFYSQAIDIFETFNNNLLINEMQCYFGQSDPYQMLINGIPGRYIFKNGHWFFEKGNFNKIESYELRLKHVIKLLNAK